jgi:hypothetical protein
VTAVQDRAAIAEVLAELLGRASSSHRGGQAPLAAFWPPSDAQRRQLLRTSEQDLGRSKMK